MAQPGVLRARQPRVAAGLEFAVLGAAHAIDALVEVLGAVEAIEHDLRLGVGYLGARGLHVRLPHVHRDRLHLRPLRRGQPQGPEGFQALPLAVVGDEQHPRALEITYHGDVVMPALEGLLVHPDVAQLERPAALQAARDRPALDPPHGVPPQLQLAGDRSHGRFPQPVDRQPLEQQRELRARSRPRDRALHHAVGRALHAGHPRVESGLELARVEMPPLPLPMIVDRARGLAFWTRRRRALGAGQPHVHGPARDLQLDPLHRPRRLHPQDRRVQLPVPHRPTSSASSAAGTIAGGVSDGHVTHTRSGRATDDNGHYHFAAWGPLGRPANTALWNSEPTLLLFKGGYKPVQKANKHGRSGPVRQTYWSGRDLPMRRSSGAEKEYASDLRLFGSMLTWNFFRSCDWEKLPHLVASVLKEAAHVPGAPDLRATWSASARENKCRSLTNVLGELP